MTELSKMDAGVLRRAIVVERDTAYQPLQNKLKSLIADLDVLRKQRSWDAEQYGKTLGSLRDKVAAAEAECKELHVIVKDRDERMAAKTRDIQNLVLEREQLKVQVVGLEQARDRLIKCVDQCDLELASE